MLPTTFELLSGGVNLMRQVREVQVEDVLGREPVRVEIDRVGAYLSGRVVLVTGAGGSIGAELCRQIARVGPKLLVLVENSENALFEIRRELEEERHFSRAASVLADCKDATRVREVFEEHAPSVVFHAAAYKHVPLMEENPVEAVRNNAVATRIVAAAAGEAGVERFVLVSTDKAVSPATVMGASKALAEWAVEAAQNRWKGTRYASVRFGNVLGSSGSVVPIFRRQIAKGGPVTVTDSHMTRYFMTIPEAVQLIIRSGELATGGEVFVLEMGDPVKIVDLAANMIRLAGYEPDVDIAIEMVGRRPGEKIHEELFNPGERPAAHARREDRLRDPAAARPGVGRERLRTHRGAGLRRRRGGAGGRGGGAVRGARAGGHGHELSARGDPHAAAAFYSSTLAGDRPGDRRLRRAGLGGGAGGALGPLLLAGPRREAAARVGRARARALGAGAPGRAGSRGGAAAAAGRAAATPRAGAAARARRTTPGGRDARGPGRPARRRRQRAPQPATAQQGKPGGAPVPAGQNGERVARAARLARRASGAAERRGGASAPEGGAATDARRAGAAGGAAPAASAGEQASAASQAGSPQSARKRAAPAGGSRSGQRPADGASGQRTRRPAERRPSRPAGSAGSRRAAASPRRRPLRPAAAPAGQPSPVAAAATPGSSAGAALRLGRHRLARRRPRAVATGFAGAPGRARPPAPAVRPHAAASAHRGHACRRLRRPGRRPRFATRPGRHLAPLPAGDGDHPAAAQASPGTPPRRRATWRSSSSACSCSAARPPTASPS